MLPGERECRWERGGRMLFILLLRAGKVGFRGCWGHFSWLLRCVLGWKAKGREASCLFLCPMGVEVHKGNRLDGKGTHTFLTCKVLEKPWEWIAPEHINILFPLLVSQRRAFPRLLAPEWGYVPGSGQGAVADTAGVTLSQSKGCADMKSPRSLFFSPCLKVSEAPGEPPASLNSCISHRCPESCPDPQQTLQKREINYWASRHCHFLAFVTAS